MSGSGQVDIEKIMAEIRAEAERIRTEEPPVEFDEIPIAPDFRAAVSTLGSALGQAEQTRVVQPEQPLSGGIRGFFKRLIRKFIRFYVFPCVESQNRFNLHTVESLRAVSDILTAQSDRSDAADSLLLRQRVAKLERNGRMSCRSAEGSADKSAEQIHLLTEQVKTLQRRLDALETAIGRETGRGEKLY